MVRLRLSSRSIKPSALPIRHGYLHSRQSIHPDPLPHSTSRTQTANEVDSFSDDRPLGLLLLGETKSPHTPRNVPRKIHRTQRHTILCWSSCNQSWTQSGTELLVSTIQIGSLDLRGLPHYTCKNNQEKRPMSCT